MRRPRDLRRILWLPAQTRTNTVGTHSHNCTVPLFSHPEFPELPPSSLPSKTSAPTPTLLVQPLPLFSSTSSSFFLFSSLQDASLLRLPGAHARHVQAGLQGSVLALCLSVLLVVKDLYLFQNMAPSSSPPTLSTTVLVTSLTSRPTLPSKRVCLTSTTTGKLLRLQKTSLLANIFPPSRTGIIYNVTPSAVGVIINKVVGGRYIEKRVNIRVEHIRHSKCRQEFLDRVQRNHDAHVAAREKGGELSSYYLEKT